MNNTLFLIPLLPLFAFFLNALLGKKNPKTVAGAIATLAVAASFILSVSEFLKTSESYEPRIVDLFTWFDTGSLKLSISLYFDQLSLLFSLIITGIGALIHLYSIGYMHDDEGHNRFFMYLNLFIFFMLMLVLGANYLITFIGWEGVGLCSYLLIGFWYKNQEYNHAAKKAFVMNRIGDLGFLLGMFLIFQTFGSLDFVTVFKEAPNFSSNQGIIVAITLLLFVGATGKSAQVPLFTWLPDAMAGPTPVSALIHAATMVTAGIYLLVRSHVLFNLAPDTLNIVLIVGFVTAAYGALVGLKQMDIKKVLAYSTVSQLGFMFIALGLGAYTTAFFHVLTHAFFKALLFLAAGSVIHAVGGEQDIRLMGGLWKKIPLTGITFLIGSLAISGIPVFAGFFSKDEILAETFMHNPVLWGVLAFISALTAFYMFRLFFVTFFGSYRGSYPEAKIHESPWTMTLPLIILAVLSTIGGFLGVPHVLGGHHWLNHYLMPIYAELGVNEAHEPLSHSLELTLMALSVCFAIISIAFAYTRYVAKKKVPQSDSEQKALPAFLYHKMKIDETYEWLIEKPIMYLSGALNNLIERRVIDGFVNLLGNSAIGAARVLRLVQTGNIGFYFFAVILGILVLILLNLSL